MPRPEDNVQGVSSLPVSYCTQGCQDLVVSTSELLSGSLGWILSTSSLPSTHPNPPLKGQPRGESAKPSHPHAHAELFPKRCPFVLAVASPCDTICQKAES